MPQRIDRAPCVDEDCRGIPQQRLTSARLRQAAQTAASFAVRMTPCVLLSMADLLGMPSALPAAYLMAAGCCGAAMPPALAGSVLGLALRWLWGMPVNGVLALCCLMAAVLWRLVRGAGNGWLMAGTAAALLPLMVRGMLAGSAQEALLCLASTAVGILSAPMLVRAVEAIHDGRRFDELELRLAVGWLLGLMLCGGARVLALQTNLGVLSAALVTCAMGMYCGASAGVVTGLSAGLLLALMRLPPVLSAALALGGLASGVLGGLEKRRLCGLAFAGASLPLLLLSGAVGMGCGWALLIGALLPAACFGAPEKAMARFFHRFVPAAPAPGDAYAAAALAEWQRTVSEMACAVPKPRQETGERGAAWWRDHLCADCPDHAACQAMLSDLACSRAESIWQKRHEEDEAWQQSLEELRGLGCGRLYCLRAGMDHLRTEEALREAWVKRACFQRDMLVTQLEAVAGAAERFAALSGGGTWQDETGARRLRLRLAETSLPLSLLYVRRVDGHAVAALEGHRPEAAAQYAEDARRLCSGALGVEMNVERIGGGQLVLREKPVYGVQIGLFGQGIGPHCVTGDAACTCRLSDGRMIAALSDGMGQGDRAGEESAWTVNLLRLCMQAGYTRTQTLTAVNGMMLLETGGERFATADLITVDLWTGEATLDKLGAAGSWLMRGSTLAELTGDALPIGILETVESRTSIMSLRPGDRILLMSDGVEDAFADRDDLQQAIRDALTEPSAQDAAQLLVQRAEKASTRPDDRTALVLQIERAG